MTECRKQKYKYRKWQHERNGLNEQTKKTIADNQIEHGTALFCECGPRCVQGLILGINGFGKRKIRRPKKKTLEVGVLEFKYAYFHNLWTEKLCNMPFSNHLQSLLNMTGFPSFHSMFHGLKMRIRGISAFHLFLFFCCTRVCVCAQFNHSGSMHQQIQRRERERQKITPNKVQKPHEMTQDKITG